MTNLSQASRACLSTLLAVTPTWIACSDPVSTPPMEAESAPRVEVERGEESQEPEREQPESNEVARPNEPVTLWIGGDVMSSAQIRDAAVAAPSHASGIASMFESLSPLWQAPGHFVLVNLETPVTSQRRLAHQDEEPAQGRLTAVRLNAPPYLVEGLKLAGVDAVSLANNHALDQGDDGLEETIEHARNAGLIVSGAGRMPHEYWPITLGQGAAELSVFNFYDAPRRARTSDDELALAVVSEEAFGSVEACQSANIVVVVHVLGELLHDVEDDWRVWAARFADAGASAIIVHGTHVPMAVERLHRGERSVIVAWGLGNLLTDMGRMASPRRSITEKINDPETREGLLARITSSADGLDVAFVPVFETDDRFIRWHGDLPPGEVTFWIRPLSACDPAVELPSSWPEPYRSEYADWMTRRRAHIVSATGLQSEACPSALLR